jgi:hypothetical protein
LAEVGRALGVRRSSPSVRGLLSPRRFPLDASPASSSRGRDDGGGSTRGDDRSRGCAAPSSDRVDRRSPGALEFDVPYASLLEIALPTYQPEACQLCAQGLAVVKPGSRTVTA